MDARIGLTNELSVSPCEEETLTDILSETKVCTNSTRDLVLV